jgi:hypothetical protein
MVASYGNDALVEALATHPRAREIRGLATAVSDYSPAVVRELYLRGLRPQADGTFLSME